MFPSFSNPNMRHWAFATLFPLFLSSATFTSASESLSKPKSKLNTQIYEADATEQSFSGKVRIVRDISEETEVFFEESKNSGPYTLPSNLPSYGLFKSRLEKSKKPGGPKVRIVVDNDRIKSVEVDEMKDRAPTSEKDVIESIFKK